MTTYATLKSDIDNFLARNDIANSTDAATIVRLAEAAINRQVRVRDMETTTTLSATSRTTALPSDFLDMRSVSVDSSTGRTLDYMTPNVIRTSNIWDSSAGQPQAFSIENNNIILAPAPTSATLDIVYFAKYAALADPTDTNFLLANHYDLYLFFALANACIFLQDWEGQDRYMMLAMKCVDDLDKAERRARMFVGAPVAANGNPRAIV